MFILEVSILAVLFFGLSFFFLRRKKTTPPSPEEFIRELRSMANRLEQTTDDGKLKMLKDAFEASVPIMEDLWVEELRILMSSNASQYNHTWEVTDNNTIKESKYLDNLGATCTTCGCTLRWSVSKCKFTYSDDKPVPSSCDEYKMSNALD